MATDEYLHIQHLLIPPDLLHFLHKMVAQQPVNLHEPLDETKDATLRIVPLQPSLATAALTLHGDYYRQLQSKSNTVIVWHPLVQLYIFGILGAFTVYKYSELWEISDSYAELWRLIKNNKYILTTFFPVLIFIAGTVGLVSFLITDEFRTVSDGLAGEEYMLKLFQFPLRVYAAASIDDLASKTSRQFVESASNSTDLIEYRETPVAVVTVIPLANESNSEVFHAKISGLHVRKVYRNAGLDEDLLEVAIGKAKLLTVRYIEDNKIKGSVKTVLRAEAYSFDPILSKLYISNGFKLIESSTNVNPFAKKQDTLFGVFSASSLMSFFSIYRQTYELEIEGTTSAVAKTLKVTSARKRK